ncbi:unnamed protein product [Absidia cylindrospora]
MDSEIDELLDLGIVSLVDSPRWASPAHMVKKADGTFRLVGDYKQINNVTEKVNYTFTAIHTALESIGQSSIFTKLDLASGYWQIPVRKGDMEKTALSTRNGVYQFHVMPFGLSNAPATFQSLMDKVLGHLKWSCCTCYMDDIVIYSNNIQDHIKHITLVLDALLSANLSIKLSKCKFAVPQIKYLGFVISVAGIQSDPDKIAPILQFPPPKTIKHIERFLGMANVYHRFISAFVVKSEPLRRLKKKGVSFHWSPEQAEAFSNLQQDLASLPTLKQPNFLLPFEIHSDAASTQGIAVILCQRHDGHPFPLSFASRSLSPAERNYSVQELEALAIYWGVKKFRCYIECSQVTIYTDHSSLSWLLDTKEHQQPRLWRWALLLKQYDLNIVYIKGSTNHAADALSRHPLPNINAISSSFTALNTIDWKAAQSTDPALSKLLQDRQRRTKHNYIITNAILFKRLSRPSSSKLNPPLLVVPQSLHDLVINQHHFSQWSGHYGINKTIKKIFTSRLWWSTIYDDVKAALSKCDICQRAKSPKHPASLQYRDTTGNYPFHRVSLDFFGPLPTSTAGNKYVLVVADTFTRYIELYPIASPNHETLIHTLYSQFVPRHGLPFEWLSDNGPPFGSSFVQHLSQAFQVDIKFTPAYHPQSNGVIEKFMGTLRRMILTYTHQLHVNQQWDTQLRIFRFIYNTTHHSATNNTPFFLVHGREARLPLISGHVQQPKPSSHSTFHDDNALSSTNYINDLNHNLNTAFDIIYDNHKDHRPDPTPNPFAETDLVLLFNTQMTNKQHNRHRKLLLDWIGPYIVTHVNSPTTVNIKDTTSKKAYSNVHVKRLKPYTS